ncbi:MAG: MotA/TolQ/ExbB proton channel family protein [Sedimentisphaerales bacterium]|nr:MotA/TolQ/ExbB proton channel family protein [Sedimentisphaerales bacterium]
MPKRLLSLSVLINLIVVLGQTNSVWAANGNTNGFERFFIAGGPLVWLVLGPLSIITCMLIVRYFLAFRNKRLLPPTVGKRFEFLLSQPGQAGLREFIEEQSTLLGRALAAGYTQTTAGPEATLDALHESLQQDASLLNRRLEWLNLIGNVAPMIGLFGTVWGMIDAFNGIVQAGGQPQPADLAQGISVALVTTWWGLIIAIPALAAYGSLRQRLDACTAEAALTAEAILLPLAK